MWMAHDAGRFVQASCSSTFRMTTDPKYGRRDFLKDSVLSVAKAAREYSKHSEAVPEKPVPAIRKDWLRPPGAVEEMLFLERCTACSDCVKACPYGSLVLHHENATPVIFPDEIPCYLCDDFPCITACATDALLPVSREAVRMGMAVVNFRLCTAGQGCHACASKCPTDALSMDFDTQRMIVDQDQCVGCGICEQICKTVNDHIAIRVTPERSLTGR
ncbi:4Fe-4S dicluster domain-containing protein [Nitrospira sp. KM1]|uniref:4Fe-4S dicluster domain-containing protein n=1 Tax=Nitrospira sp. KM1 TaxID=1936990 RepID=UPI003519DAC7